LLIGTIEPKEASATMIRHHGFLPGNTCKWPFQGASCRVTAEVFEHVVLRNINV